MLELLEVSTLSLHIEEFFFQSATHGRARFQAGASQIQETSDLAEFESETLHATDKSQRLDVALAVLAEAPLRPRGLAQQGAALVEPNRINAEPNLFCDDANLHRLGSSPRSYTLEYSPESTSFCRWTLWRR